MEISSGHKSISHWPTENEAKEAAFLALRVHRTIAPELAVYIAEIGDDWHVIEYKP